ncbi:hypothetical protein OUZ56_019585 [Daphnia magna]|uniref:Uncharacterized protein n=1 Tax=Daphnia magna TaxID=35525 RepID=A0ABQ9ZC03_9CRUS|nr:hypothetical protein OUZ56_019585 [Daphnia magna]
MDETSWSPGYVVGLFQNNNTARQNVKTYVSVGYKYDSIGIVNRNQETEILLTGVSVFVFLTPSLVVEAQRTVTRTQTVTVFSSEIVTRNFACAKLVNVTGPCRRGRGGLLIDVPVILTFDEELEDSLDDTFNRIVHQQFVPSRTLGVEVTPLAIVPVGSLQHAANFKYFSRNQLNSPSPTNHVVQSSQEPSARNPGRNKVGAEGSDPKPRIYFSQINSVLNQIVNNFRPAVTVRVTNFVTRTTRVTAGSLTGSFFIMGCTPNPFTFATCATAPRSIST